MEMAENLSSLFLSEMARIYWASCYLRQGELAMSDANIRGIKSALHLLADTLPDNATWDDVMYRVCVRQAVDAGLQDSAEGRLVDVAEVRRQFGLVQ